MPTNIVSLNILRNALSSVCNVVLFVSVNISVFILAVSFSIAIFVNLSKVLHVMEQYLATKVFTHILFGVITMLMFEKRITAHMTFKKKNLLLIIN